MPEIQKIWKIFQTIKITSLYMEILQILSVSVFDKTPVNQLFTKTELQKMDAQFSNQLNLFDL